jgi:hypothetical protein
MASPEASKTSLELRHAKPLHGRARTMNQVKTADISPAINAVGRPGWTVFRVSQAQTKAKASKLEQSRAIPPAVRARKPSETRSLFRMTHPPTSCSSEFIKAFGMSDFERSDTRTPPRVTPASGYPRTHGRERFRLRPDPSSQSLSRTLQSVLCAPSARAANGGGLAQSKRFRDASVQ